MGLMSWKYRVMQMTNGKYRLVEFYPLSTGDAWCSSELDFEFDDFEELEATVSRMKTAVLDAIHEEPVLQEGDFSD